MRIKERILKFLAKKAGFVSEVPEIAKALHLKEREVKKALEELVAEKLVLSEERLEDTEKDPISGRTHMGIEPRHVVVYAITKKGLEILKSKK